MATTRRTGLLVALLVVVLALLGGALWLVLAPSETSDPAPDAVDAEPVPVADGSPRPAAPPPRDRVTADAETEAPATSAGDPDRPTAPTHSPIAPTRTVHVTVRMWDGGPSVRGAHVTAFSSFGNITVSPRDATTDPDGKTTLTITGTSNFRVHAWTDELAAIGDRVAVDPDAELDVLLELHPARIVAGRVESDVRTPVPGARVWTKLPTTDPFGLFVVTHSDAEGAFTLGGIPDRLVGDEATRILASARGYVRVAEPLAAYDDPTRLLLQLQRGQIVRGRCVAAGAAPVAGVRVTASGVESVSTGGDGTFVLEGVAREGALVELRPDEHVVPPPIHLLPGTGEVDLGDILLAVGRPVSGIVVDDREQPVPWANVHAFEQESQREVRTGNADHEGRFTLPHLGEVPHTIVAQATQGGEWSSRPSGRVQDVTAGTTGLRIVLSGGLSLVVTFRSQADNEPVQVASAEVEVTRIDVEAGRTVSAWAGPGMTSVRVAFEEPGRYQVVVKVPGYEPATLEDIEILGDRATRIDALFRSLPE